MSKNDYMEVPGKRGEIAEEVYAILLREKLLRYQALEVLETVQKRIDIKSVIS